MRTSTPDTPNGPNPDNPFASSFSAIDSGNSTQAADTSEKIISSEVIPATPEEFVVAFVAGMYSQRDEIVRYEYNRREASKSGDALPEITAREIINIELDRLAGHDPSKRADIAFDVLSAVTGRLKIVNDPEFSGIILNNLLDVSHRGESSLMNELSLSDAVLVAEQTLSTSYGQGIPTVVEYLPIIMERDLGRIIDKRKNTAEQELSEAILASDAKTALRLLRGLESTGALISTAIHTHNIQYEDAFSAISSAIQNAENHSSPLVTIQAQDSFNNLQIENLCNKRVDLKEIQETYHDQLNLNILALKEVESRPVAVGKLPKIASIIGSTTGEYQIASDAIGVFNHVDQLRCISECEFSDQDGKLVASEKSNSDADQQVFIAGENLDTLLISLHEPSMRKHIEDHLGVSLCEVSLDAQKQLLTFMAGANRYTYDRLGEMLQNNSDLGADFLESFLIVSEDKSHANTLLELGEGLTGHSEASRTLFGAYRELADRARHDAGAILADLQSKYPNSGYTEQDVTLSLLFRGRDLLLDSKAEISKHPEDIDRLIAQATERIKQLSLESQVIEQEFGTMAALLAGDEISLSEQSARQQLIETSFKNPEIKAQVLGALARKGLVKPIPELHWRVDRTLPEYSQRLGFDLETVLRTRSQEATFLPQTVLELGPGSGKALSQITEIDQQQSFVEFGLADNVYFSIEQVIGNLIDFDELESQAGGSLGSKDRAQLAHFLYASLVITPGETAQDSFTYDEAAMALLSQDVNNLKSLWSILPGRLSLAATVPTGISARTDSGELTYSDKLDKSHLSSAAQEALKYLEKDTEACLVNDWQTTDYWTKADVTPGNIMIGSLTEIQRIAKNELDVTLASRSTVYLRGAEYSTFITNTYARLKAGGIMIDDSIRDNDGWYYRFAELLVAQSQIADDSSEWLVVLGPGLPGEDHRQTEVPISFIVTKGGRSRATIESARMPGTTIMSLADLVSNPDNANYFRSLDASGETYARLQAALGSIA